MKQDPAGLRIRAVTPDDLAAVTAIYAHAVVHGTASFEMDPPTLDEMIRRHAALAADGHPYLVAEQQGVVLGYAYAGPYRTRPAYRSTVEDSIYLSPDARGAGIGRALLSALVDAAAEASFRQMVAVIGDSANAPSIRLHERLGFRLVGVFENVGWKNGRWLDSVLMQRGLGAAATSPPAP